MERKLAAILAADVVGFAGLVARDEEAALSRLERLMRDVIGMQVEAHRGRVFKSLGDGVLAEFSSTIEAVKCAMGIHKGIAIEARRSGDGEPMILRIGVSVGDVVMQGGDLLGEGVNIAARLQAMADPGGIAVSGEVMSQVRGKVDLALVDCGYSKLKQTDELLHVYKSGHADRQARGLFDFDADTPSQDLIEGGCLCGAVRFQIDMPAISTGYCHCRICQKFTGSAMSAWTAFPASAVRFTAKEPRYFQSSPIAERGFCAECGSGLTYRLMKPKPAAYLIVFTPSLENPQQFAPVVHSGIESKLPWIEIADDLPRTTCAESRVLQEAWEAVGISDPAEWGSKAGTPDAT